MPPRNPFSDRLSPALFERLAQPRMLIPFAILLLLLQLVGPWVLLVALPVGWWWLRNVQGSTNPRGARIALECQGAEEDEEDTDESGSRGSDLFFQAGAASVAVDEECPEQGDEDGCREECGDACDDCSESSDAGNCDSGGDSGGSSD